MVMVLSGCRVLHGENQSDSKQRPEGECQHGNSPSIVRWPGLRATSMVLPPTAERGPRLRLLEGCGTAVRRCESTPTQPPWYLRLLFIAKKLRGSASQDAIFVNFPQNRLIPFLLATRRDGSETRRLRSDHTRLGCELGCADGPPDRINRLRWLRPSAPPAV